MSTNKTYTFKGTGDFSDFNQKAKQAASSMGDSFKRAYDEMLRNASEYSNSSKKQIDYLSKIYDKFKQDQSSSMDSLFDSLFEESRSTSSFRLENLKSWKKSKLDSSQIVSSYEEETGQKYDPYSINSQQFKQNYQNKVESEYRERKKEIISEGDILGNSLDSLKESLEKSLGDLSPKEYFSKLKDLAKEQVLEAKNQGRNLSDVVRQLEDSEKIEDKLLASQIREEISSERRYEKSNKLPGENESSSSLLKSLSNYGYLDRIVNSGVGLARSKNGSELFGSMVDTVGSAGGGLSQLLMTGIGGGIGGPLGAAIGGAGSVIFGKAVEGGIKIIGEAVKRTMDERESLSSSQNKLRSLSGTSSTFRDLSYQGIDYKTFVEEQYQLSKSKGSKIDNNSVESSLSLQKGLSLDRGVINSLFEVQRNTSKDITSTIGRILGQGEGTIFKGGDRTFLGEFTQKFLVLQKDFLKSQTSVSDTRVMDVFKMFNSVGGQFSSNDFRSLGNIQAINSSLRSPGNDALKALSYKLVSDRNPGADMFDIQLEMQKGLSNPNLFKDRLSFLKQNYGNDPELFKMEIAQQFGLQDNLQAAKDIYQNVDKILSSKFSETELSSKYGLGDFKGQAEKSTTLLEQNQARITNEFVKSAVDGMKMAGDALVDTVKQAFAGATFVVKNGEVTFERGSIVSNSTKTNIAPKKNKDVISSGQYLGMGVWRN